MSMSAYFSPHGGCTTEIIGWLSRARKSVHWISYSFTSAPIAAALGQAYDRLGQGCVRGIVDARQCNEPAGQAHALAARGIDVVADACHPICHDKYILIDELTILTGSFNHSVQAESNAENLVVITNRRLAALYLADWEVHRAHSIPLLPPLVGGVPHLVEVVYRDGEGWRIEVDRIDAGEPVANSVVAEDLATWLRTALPDLESAICPSDAEGVIRG